MAGVSTLIELSVKPPFIESVDGTSNIQLTAQPEENSFSGFIFEPFPETYTILDTRVMECCSVPVS